MTRLGLRGSFNMEVTFAEEAFHPVLFLHVILVKLIAQGTAAVISLSAHRLDAVAPQHVFSSHGSNFFLSL